MTSDLTANGNTRRRPTRVRNPPKEPWVPMTRQMRAEPYYLVYSVLGSERSLTKLHEIATAGGLKISKRTLETYSADFDWPARAAQFDAERAYGLGAERDVLARSIADDAMQARLAQNLIKLANVNAERTLAMLSKVGNEELTNLEGPALARVAEVGVRIARAVGVSVMDKRDVMLAVVSLIHGPITQLYTQSFEAAMAYLQSVLGDAFTDEMRENAWREAATLYGPGVDRFIDAAFQSAGIGDVVLGELADDANEGGME